MLPMFMFSFFFFFFNDTATTEIYTLSLHDALPISFVVLRGLRHRGPVVVEDPEACADRGGARQAVSDTETRRSEEHTSELQSHLNLVCRLLLEKKKRSTDERFKH